jgi:hypothetical protein
MGYGMMTLGNMRQQGVRSLSITCGALHCHHGASMDVSDFADEVMVPAFGPRMVCTVCGAIGADARPNWNERAPVSLFWCSSMVALTILVFLTSTGLAQDQKDAVRDCMKNVMLDFAKQKASKIQQDPKQLLSIESTLADRRAEEQYCLRAVECQRPLFPKNDLLPMALGAIFSRCLKDEAIETYDLEERK